MENLKVNYYKIVAKCGHVGRKQYIPIQFAVKAINGREAAKIVRQFPRVKRNHKDAILKCNLIDYSEYIVILTSNQNDPYLNVKSKQAQNAICDLSERLVQEPSYQESYIDQLERRARARYKLSKEMLAIREELTDYEYIY